jgi:hypothetical protein
VAIWDRANVEGRLRFLDMVTTARKWCRSCGCSVRTSSWSARTAATREPPATARTCRTRTRPIYNYDTLSGVEYDIDISRPVGDRITRLTRSGVDVQPAEQFVVAVNNYRRSGGGNFPGIVKAQVYNQQQEIRQLLIDWARACLSSDGPPGRSVSSRG